MGGWINNHHFTPTPTQFYGLIVDKTSFYSEAGGQVNDVGTISLLDPKKGVVAGVFNVVDVQSYAGFIVHVGQFTTASPIDLSLPVQSITSVDYTTRSDVKPNHTMTHILNLALRTILNSNDISQKVSELNEEDEHTRDEVREIATDIRLHPSTSAPTHSIRIRSAPLGAGLARQ